MLIGDAAQDRVLAGIALAVAHQAGDLGVVHREDHGAGGAGLAERVADIGQDPDRSALAAELDRNSGAEQPVRAHRGHGLFREASVAVDGIGMGGRDGGDSGGA